MPLPEGIPAQVGFAVSKRNFKKAVDRNRIKRLMREAYRLQKEILYSGLRSEKKSLAILVVYQPKSLPEFRSIHDKTALYLSQLAGIMQSEK